MPTTSFRTFTEKEVNNQKIAVVFDSKTGGTQRAGEFIAEGLNSVDGVEARTFNIEKIDTEFANEAKGVILGTPTYMASLTADMKVWLDKHAVTEVGFVGKLCGVFATEGYIHGGADLAMSTIIDHMLVFGGMVYSAGGSKGSPTIHLGPVALSPNVDDYKELCEVYGKRFAEQAVAIFGK